MTAPADSAPVAPAAPAPTPAPAPAPAAAPEAAAASAAEPGTAPADGSKEQTPAPRAPEAYAEFLQGDGQPLDAERAEFFSKAARELDLTQEQAQQLVKLGMSREAATVERVNEASAKWLSQLPTDKEFGGEKLGENLAVAKAAIDAFGTPELKELLNQTKLGNHPEIIRAFYRAGLQISQDNRFVAGGSGAVAGQRDPAKQLYPNQ